MPKFNKGQEVWQIVFDEELEKNVSKKVVITYMEYSLKGGKYQFLYWTSYWGSYVPIGYDDTQLFATKEQAEEALKKLEEI